jgi:hypothetical protein
MEKRRDFRRRIRNANVSFARDVRFPRHLRRMRRRMAGLPRDGRADRNVLAILAVEGFYRPRPRRAFEYAGWLALSAVGNRSVGRITVGPAQVRLSHWRDLGMLESTRFSVRRFLRVHDLDTNYEVCRRYLQERRILGEGDVTVITRAYAGAPRGDYATMLQQALAAI